MFSASQPRVTVNATNVTQDYWPVMIAQAVAGAGADLWQGQSERFPEWGGKGLALYVEPYVKRDARGMNTGDFVATATDQYRFHRDRRTLFEGDTHAIPYMTTLGMFYYNLDAVQQAGAKAPPRDGNWTWDEFLTLARALTRVKADQTLEKAAFFLHPSWTYHLPWIWSSGGDYFSKDGARWVLDFPELRAALQAYVDYRYKHRVAPVPNVDFVGQNATDLFVNGTVAMLLGNTGNQTTLKDRAPAFRWDLAHWPKGKAGQATFLAGDAVLAWSGTKAPDAAWEFMKYSVGPAAEERYGAEGIHMPSREVGGGEGLRQARDALAGGAQPGGGQVRPPAPDDGRLPPLHAGAGQVLRADDHQPGLRRRGAAEDPAGGGLHPEEPRPAGAVLGPGPGPVGPWAVGSAARWRRGEGGARVRDREQGSRTGAAGLRDRPGAPGAVPGGRQFVLPAARAAGRRRRTTATSPRRRRRRCCGPPWSAGSPSSTRPRTTAPGAARSASGGPSRGTRGATT